MKAYSISMSNPHVDLSCFPVHPLLRILHVNLNIFFVEFFLLQQDLGLDFLEYQLSFLEERSCFHNFIFKHLLLFQKHTPMFHPNTFIHIWCTAEALLKKQIRPLGIPPKVTDFCDVPNILSTFRFCNCHQYIYFLFKTFQFSTRRPYFWCWWCCFIQCSHFFKQRFCNT